MAKTKRYRWVCPMCDEGKLASSRPKKTATVRYCLPCSERTGELVERTCPVLTNKRETKIQRQESKRKKKAVVRQATREEERKNQQQENARVFERVRVGFGINLAHEYTRLWRLARRVLREQYPDCRVLVGYHFTSTKSLSAPSTQYRSTTLRQASFTSRLDVTLQRIVWSLASYVVANTDISDADREPFANLLSREAYGKIVEDLEVTWWNRNGSEWQVMTDALLEQRGNVA